MHKFYKSLFDASVYLQQPDQNAGRDEIIEVGKLYYGDIKDINRALLKFDISTISASVAAGDITGSWKAYLNLYAANSEEIPLEYTIYANAISQSWTMGTGTKFDNITTDGVSWKYRDGVNKWQDNTTGGSAVFTAGTTGSANAEGGTWYTGSEASQSYNYEPDDVRMDVTGIVNLWISGSLPNHGFIVRHSLANEENTIDYGVLKFYSKETSTIYEPKLEIVWNDSTFLTGSLTPITGSSYADVFENSSIVFTNLKKQYLVDSLVKIRVKGRDRYPLKSFGTTFAYDQSKYLPQTTYYQIEDYITKQIIVPFGDYSKLSCDSISNYFELDTTSYPTNRVYSIKLKIVNDGVTQIIDDKTIFEIVDR
jgi:hypothetical protein